MWEIFIFMQSFAKTVHMVKFKSHFDKILAKAKSEIFLKPIHSFKILIFGQTINRMIQFES